MSILRNVFTGTPGAVVTPANSASGGDAFAVVSSTVVYANDQSLRSGGVSASVPTSDVAGYVQYNTPTPEPKVASRSYHRLGAANTADNDVIRISTDGDITAVYARIRPDGTIRLYLPNYVTAWASPSALPLNKWLRLELYAEAGTSTTTGKGRLAVYDGDSTTPLMDSGVLTGIDTGGGAGYTRARFGRVSPTTFAGPFHFDDIELRTGNDATTSMIGPSAGATAPVVTPANELVQVWDYEDGTIIPPWTEIHALRGLDSTDPKGPQIAVVSSDPAPFPGTTRSAQFNVRPGDTGWGGTSGTLRSEVRTSELESGSARDANGNRIRIAEGHDQWWAWPTYFRSDFDWDERNQFLIFTQWHQTKNSGNPNIHLWSDVNEHFMLDVRGGTGGQTSGDAQYVSTYDLGPLVLGAWNTFKVHIVWSTDPTVGLVEIWHNGVKVHSHKDATLYVGQSIYIKQGIYSAAGTTRQHFITHGPLALGTSEAAVNPYIALDGPVVAGLQPPSNFKATPVSNTQINLSWTPAPTATAVDIERDGEVIASEVPGSSYSDTNLASQSTHTYRIRSVKAS